MPGEGVKSGQAKLLFDHYRCFIQEYTHGMMVIVCVHVQALGWKGGGIQGKSYNFLGFRIMSNNPDLLGFRMGSFVFQLSRVAHIWHN